MLRGGPLAEPRVIDLVNRRFVFFYFNVGRGQPGYDLEAASFVALLDDRFGGSSVPTPPVWVVSPEEELLATIDNYTPKDEFFSELMGLLQRHPELNRPTRAEQAVLEGPRGARAADLAEELGDYALARELFESIRETAPVAAHLGLARIARYEAEPEAQERELSWLTEHVSAEDERACDVALERAHRYLATGDFAAARELLVEAIRRWPASPRMGELHFYAGVAAFRAEDRPWAHFHWCWVMENIPGDFNYMRCYLAATADALPYPNPELGGYKSDAKMISHALADAARERALADYQRLLETWNRGR